MKEGAASFKLVLVALATLQEQAMEGGEEGWVFASAICSLIGGISQQMVGQRLKMALAFGLIEHDNSTRWNRYRIRMGGSDAKSVESDVEPE